MPARVIASCFAIVGFVASCVTGLMAANRAETIIWRAMLVMGACYVVGRLVGHVTQRTLDAHIAQYKLDHPMPGDANLGEGSSGTVEVVEDDQPEQEGDDSTGEAAVEANSGQSASGQSAADASSTLRSSQTSGSSEKTPQQNKAA